MIINLISRAHQLLIVIADDWKTTNANMYCFDIDDNSNHLKRHSIPVVIGKNGLAWEDYTLQALEPNIATKTEGDSKAPAGVFTLGKSFGFGATVNKYYPDYVELNTCIECVHDMKSRYYNQIINNKNISQDWSSSEKMSTIDIYKYGLEVQYNHSLTVAGKGSCIFIHIWKGSNIGTEGCTAMAESDMINVLKWLDYNKKPVLIQLTKAVYKRVQQDWQLPKVRELYE